MRALTRYSWLRIQIWRSLIVDNGSDDDSVGRFKEDYPSLRLIENAENLGFARGCNVGIHAGLSEEADYLLLLNSDVVVTPGFLEPLIACALSSSNMGLASGKILLAGDRKRIWFAGGRISRFLGAAKVRGHFAPDAGQFDRCELTGACTGAMMLIPRRVVEELGALPEEYFFGMEEWDYSLTVKQAGYDLLYCGQSVVYHESDGSHVNMSPKFIYCGHRNRLVFLTRFNGSMVTRLFIAIYTVYVRTVAARRLRFAPAQAHAMKTAWAAAVRDHSRSPRLWIERDELEDFEREHFGNQDASGEGSERGSDQSA